MTDALQVGSPTLRAALETMPIEEATDSPTFEQALADANGWSLDRARRVSAEYRRFLYLAATSDREVTPSVAVDKAWHLHLACTRHYRDVLCGEILGRPLHHRPSRSGAVESERCRRQYLDTLALYEATFGTPPPPSVWPRSTGRARGRAAPGEEGRSAPWPLWLAGGLFVSVLTAAAAGPLASLAAASLCLIAYIVARALAEAGRRPPSGPVGASCGGGGYAGWGDGTGDCADAGGSSCGASSCGGGGCGGD
jgi:hypothetical protein